MDNDEEPIHVLSLGAGVQSSCMALMAAKGEITPMPVAAIFADTKAEPQSVYDWLDYITPLLPFPVYVVQEKDGLLADVERGIKGSRCSNPPIYTKAEDGTGGILTRTCTADYKIRPLIRKTKELVGWKGRKPKEVRCITWIGISLDEIQRVKESREPWIKHRWPLLEKDMRRHQCLQWMKGNGYPEPPRSACWFCPYHSNDEWRRLRDKEPDEWEKAKDLDRRIRSGVYNVKSELYLHKSREPLDEVDLSTDVERGQTVLDLWNDECDGVCML
tara:strand:- start:47 stop:868 length:822 start_codon:yes stop_codon:yes gene_type:complete